MAESSTLPTNVDVALKRAHSRSWPSNSSALWSWRYISPPPAPRSARANRFFPSASNSSIRASRSASATATTRADTRSIYSSGRSPVGDGSPPANHSASVQPSHWGTRCVMPCANSDRGCPSLQLHCNAGKRFFRPKRTENTRPAFSHSRTAADREPESKRSPTCDSEKTGTSVMSAFRAVELRRSCYRITS